MLMNTPNNNDAQNEEKTAHNVSLQLKDTDKKALVMYLIVGMIIRTSKRK